MASGRLRLDHPEGMLALGTDVCLGRLDQIDKPALWRIEQGSALAWAHRHPECCCLASHRGPFGDALVASVRVDHFLVAMQQLGCWGEVMHVGGRGDD